MPGYSMGHPPYMLSTYQSLYVIDLTREPWS